MRVRESAGTFLSIIQHSAKMGQYTNIYTGNFSLNLFIFISNLTLLSVVCHSNAINVFHYIES